MQRSRKGGNKYYARKTVLDGIVFDSKREAERYRELLLLERLGKISGLRRQVPFELIPQQKKDGKVVERACKYVADFVYIENGETVVEDVKGYKKGGAYAVFAIKRKMFYAKYGLLIREF